MDEGALAAKPAAESSQLQFRIRGCCNFEDEHRYPQGPWVPRYGAPIMDRPTVSDRAKHVLARPDSRDASLVPIQKRKPKESVGVGHEKFVLC